MLMNNFRSPKTKKDYSLLISVFATLLIIGYVFKFVSLPQIVYSDEGDYIWTGHVITNTIREKNWSRFWQFTYPQFHYPFFQSWYLGFATLFFPYSVASSRFVSLFLLLPTIILAWLLSKQLKTENRAPRMASRLILTSPLGLFYFSNAMKEGLAACLSLLVIYTYFRGREKGKNRWFFLSSLSLLALTLTKYNYGGLILLPLAIESLIWLLKEKGYRQKKFWLNNSFLYLPFLLGFLFWLFYPTNRFGYLFPFPQANDVFNLNQTNLLGHLLFYPQTLAFSYTLSWPIFLLSIFGFWQSLKNWRHYSSRLLINFFFFNFFLAEKHIINNQARYIFTSVPVFFILCAAGLETGRQSLKNLGQKIRKNQFYLGVTISLIVLAGAIIAKDLLNLPRIISGAGSQNLQSAAFYEQDYRISMFDFNRRHWPKIPPPAKAEKLTAVIDFALENVDWNKNVFLVGGFDEFNRGFFDFYLNKTRETLSFSNSSSLKRQLSEYFVVLQVKPGSRFETLNYRYYTKLRGIDSAAETESALKDKSLIKINEKDFPYLGLTVTILGR